MAQLTQTLGGVLGIGLTALALQWCQAARGEAHGPSEAMRDVFWLLALVAALAAALTWQLRAMAPAGQVAVRQDAP